MLLMNILTVQKSVFYSFHVTLIHHSPQIEILEGGYDVSLELKMLKFGYY